ncbi:MAG: hypothetical protein QF460_00035 [Candidatus Nanoarchaeia archaeon]|nr:hypothetical protein [Candidatus Nanoarchaeia archaeon]|tara:strand:- start:752 stop:1912 length:1161 start_codon:yes stop_codon:yes gene_type:complete
MSIGRKGKTEVSPTGAVLLLIILAGFLLFILSLPQADRDDILDQLESATSEVLFEETPGAVETTTGSSSTTRYNLANFKLDSEMSSSDTVLVSSLELSSTVFSDDSNIYSFVPDWTADTIGMSFSTFIQNYVGNGQIVILLNGAEVYSGTPIVGNVLRVNLPASGMFQGTNTLEIVLDKQGANIFSSTKLGLTEVSLRTDSVGKDLVSNFNFDIDRGELVSGTYTAVIRKSGAAVPLQIELNDENIYSEVPLSTILTVPISADLFNSGDNLLSFSIGEGVSYEVLYSDLIVRSRSVENADEYFFRIDRSQARRIINGRADCLLEIFKEGGESDEVVVDLNGFVSTHSIRAGRVSFEVCDNLVYGGNTISFASDDELNLSSVRLSLV